MQWSSQLWSVGENPNSSWTLWDIGSNVAYLFILIMSCYPSMQNSGEGLPSIILAGQGILVKMLITLEPHGIF